MNEMKQTVTLKFHPIGSVAFAMAGVEGWVATLGGYSWLVTLGPDPTKDDPERKTYTAGYRSNFRAQGGISSNPINSIAKGLETFDEAADACYEEYVRMQSAH